MNKDNKTDNLKLPKIKYPFWGIISIIIIFILFLFVLSKIQIRDYVPDRNNSTNITLLDYIIQNIVKIKN